MRYKKRKHWKYRVYEDEYRQTDITPEQSIDTPFISLGMDGILIVKKDYAWDGASGPTIDTKNTMTPSLVHDALYNLFRDQLLDADKWRKYADELLRDMLIERKMWKFRARMWYRAVRKGAEQSSEYDVLTAP